jgi:hypothetical protein
MFAYVSALNMAAVGLLTSLLFAGRMSAFEQREKEREASLIAKFKACDELNNRLALREKSLHELQQELAAKMQRCVARVFSE